MFNSSFIKDNVFLLTIIFFDRKNNLNNYTYLKQFKLKKNIILI